MPIYSCRCRREQVLRCAGGSSLSDQGRLMKIVKGRLYTGRILQGDKSGPICRSSSPRRPS